MKLTYTSLACPNWTIEEAVTAAKSYGYAAIEWRLADGAIIGPDTPANIRRRLRKVPASHGIEVACLDTSCRVAQEEPKERAAAIETGRRMLDVAAEIGAPFLRVFGGELPAHTTHTSLLNSAAEVLHALGRYGAERGVTVILETHDAWTTSEKVQALLQATALSACKVLWDAHHTYRSGETPAQTLALLGEAIAYVHVKDSRLNAGEPSAWTYCLLGEGDIPLHEICTALQKRGYAGYLSFEWEKKWHPEIAEPEIALPQAAAYLRTLLK